MAFAMCVFDQHEAACRNMANLAVTGLVFYRTIKPYRKHGLRHLVPCNFPRPHHPYPCRDMGDADAGSRVASRDIERNGVRMNRPFGGRQINFVEMRLAVRRGIDAQALR